MQKLLAGVDEVGRGSLIGPVYAAAVILKRKIDRKKLKDSKKLMKKPILGPFSSPKTTSYISLNHSLKFFS